MRNDHTFGRFIEDGFAYEITDPRTPKPWTNVVSNGRFGFVVSQNGGGFSWLDNSQLNVLTRWEMDLIEDRTGKHVYVLDTESGERWSLAPSPCRPTYDDYSCRHAPGSTTFRTSCNGISASWSLSVAPDSQVEVWAIELTNDSDKPRSLRVASYLEWCCGVAPDVKREFHRLFINTEYDNDAHRMLARKVMWDVPDRTEKDHWNREWPYVAGHSMIIEGEHTKNAIGDKEVFFGSGTRDNPDGLNTPGVHASSFGRFSDACGSLGADITIQPGETRKIAYLIGVSEELSQLHAEMDGLSSLDAAFAVKEASEQSWKDRLGKTRVSTDLEDFNDLNNTWLPYQAISARLWARTGYYQQSGAFGFRDQLQDSQVWMPIDPDGMRKQILLHASQQFVDGSVYHWWHPLADFGNHTTCSDDYLWLPFAVAQYIKETNDLSILDEVTPFVDEGEATVLEHCRRSFDRAFMRTSDRGLPHIGACDWNDGLSACGIEGKGESVWLAFFLAYTLRDFAAVMYDTGSKEYADELIAKREAYISAANEHAWDGKWYRRATRDNGEWLGTSTNDAGRIYLNTQTWAILADAGPQERLDQAWDSVKEHLIRDMGPLLLAPAYSVPDTDVGYITRYTPGSRENGGVYMHAAVWALSAACKLGDNETATQIWNSISPPKRGLDVKGYRAEPYVTPGNVDGPDSATPGAAGWTWYTGSAAWLNNISLTRVLGIRPEFGGLRIEPCPLQGMGTINAKRVWRGKTIKLSCDTSGFTPGAKQITMVAGKVAEECVLTEAMLADADQIEVQVSWAKLPASELENRPANPVGVRR
ncbi:MAG: GH36-type glycosyl hydrolase domain-containing protein [Phycisphaerales bacterium JB061]